MGTFLTIYIVIGIICGVFVVNRKRKLIPNISKSKLVTAFILNVLFWPIATTLEFSDRNDDDDDIEPDSNDGLGEKNMLLFM